MLSDGVSQSAVLPIAILVSTAEQNQASGAQ